MLRLATIFTSPANAGGSRSAPNPMTARTAPRRHFEFFIANSKVQASLYHKGVGVGPEPLLVHLRIKPVWIRGAGVAIDEVTFHFQVPVAVQVHTRGHNSVVDMVAGQAGIGLTRYDSGLAAVNICDGVARVVGSRLES